MIKKRVNATRSAVGVRLSEISQGKRLWLSLILPFMCAALVCCAFLFPKTDKINAKAAMDVTTNAEIVGELAKNYTAGSWDGEFDEFNLSSLYGAITGSGTKYSDVVTALSNSTSTEAITGNKVITAADLAAVGSHVNKDIIVTLGGLEWTVVYVSNEMTNDDVIVTLLLADDLKTNGTSGVIVSSPFSSWSATNVNSHTGTYPGNMYSTSDARSVLMGTRYSTNASTLSSARRAKQSRIHI